MSCAECADALGITLDRFYRTWRARTLADGMPMPISTIGRPRWHRQRFDAWLRRDHNFAPLAPANDTAPLADQSDAEHRAALARAYAS